MPRVALRTEDQVIAELSKVPPHNPEKGTHFYIHDGVVIWTNGAIAVRWGESDTTKAAFKTAEVSPIKQGDGKPIPDFDALIPKEDEPTSRAGLDVFLVSKIFKILGSVRGNIEHRGQLYYAELELNWGDFVYEVEVLVAGVA